MIPGRNPYGKNGHALGRERDIVGMMWSTDTSPFLKPASPLHNIRPLLGFPAPGH